MFSKFKLHRTHVPKEVMYLLCYELTISNWKTGLESIHLVATSDLHNLNLNEIYLLFKYFLVCFSGILHCFEIKIPL
jgi:hypothetical protein